VNYFKKKNVNEQMSKKVFLFSLFFSRQHCSCLFISQAELFLLSEIDRQTDGWTAKLVLIFVCPLKGRTMILTANPNQLDVSLIYTTNSIPLYLYIKIPSLIFALVLEEDQRLAQVIRFKVLRIITTILLCQV
jgi:hypothetical protein